MIELMIALAIGALLVVIGLPSMQGMLNDMRLRSAQGLIISDLNHARGEAIKRNSRVLICARNAAGTDCAAANTWTAGWVVCFDDNRDGGCDDTSGLVPANPNPLVVRPALDPTLTLTGSAIAIRFNPNSSQGDGAGDATLTLGGTWASAPTRIVRVRNTGDIVKP